VVLDRLRREPTLRLEGDVGVDQLRARLEIGESVVAEEGEEVAAEDVVVVLRGRRLDVPARQVFAHEALGEVTEGDALRLPVSLVDGGEPLAKLSLSLALRPGRLGAESLLNLLARGIAVLDPPDCASLALISNDGGSSRHRAPPQVGVCGRWRRNAPASCWATQLTTVSCR